MDIVDTSELNRLERLFVRAGVEIVKVNEEALTEAAKELQANAKRDAPYDPTSSDPHLRDNIYRRGGREWRRVGSKLKQGFFQEFGTSRHPPQPWLFHNGDRAGTTVENELGKGGYRVLLGPMP